MVVPASLPGQQGLPVPEGRGKLLVTLPANVLHNLQSNSVSLC